MNKYSFIILLCLIVISCKKSTDIAIDSNSNQVNISIQQNGKVITPINGTITLDKEAFEIVFSYTDQNYILVNASFNNELWTLASINAPITMQPQFAYGNFIAETFNNPERSMYVSQSGSSAWLQTSKEKHGFNSLESNNGIYEGTRIIENIFDLDQSQNIEVQFIDQSMYLVFLIADLENDLADKKEVQRVFIKIEWKENGLTHESLSSHFHTLIKSAPIKQAPFIDSLSFRNDIKMINLTKKELNTLQLGKIYPNLFTAGYQYNCGIAYNLDMSRDFKTLIVHTRIGEGQILGSILVTYDLNGKLIDHQQIVFEETTMDNSITINLKVEDNRLLTKYLSDNFEDPQFLKIDDQGKIRTIYLNEVLLTKLGIAKDEVYEDLLSFVEVSNSKTIALIPGINKQVVDQTDLDVYLLIVNPLTGAIESTFIEKKRWIMDAIDITAIEVEYNPYRIAPDSETIGLKVYRQVDRSFNLYRSNEYNLLVRKGEELQEVMRDYEIDYYFEEKDDHGKSTSIHTTRTLQPIENDITPYYNLEVTTKTIEKITKDGELDYFDKKELFEYLKYQAGTYVKDTVE